MREDRPAEGALQEVLSFKIIQVFANRDHAHRKSVSQLAHIQGAGFLQKINDLLPALLRFHTMKG